MQANIKTAKWYTRKRFLVLVGVVIIAAAVIYFLSASRNHNDSQPTAGQATKGETTTPDTARTNQNSKASGQGEKSNSNGESSATTTTEVLQPTGNFVSAHHVHLDSNLASVCNTTPGINCTITFTSGDQVKSLGIKTTDEGGASYWNGWSPESIGLTVGTWKVSATTSSGQQSKTSNDALQLEVMN